MPSKKTKESTIKKGFKKVKAFNSEAAKSSVALIDETVKTGEQWQDLVQKTIQRGFVLMGKQQDLVFDSLETMKEQYSKGNNRLWKLISFRSPEAIQKAEKIVKATTKKATKKAKTTAKKVKKAVSDVETKASSAAKSTGKSVKDLVVKTSKTVANTPVADQNLKIIQDSTKVTTITATKKAAPKKRTKSTSSDSNFKIIEGIGPKIESLLKAGGITTFQQLATSPVEAIRAILEEAGPRYKFHDPTTWTLQARLAAEGKMEELKSWQEDLKGGKIAKK